MSAVENSTSELTIQLRNALQNNQPLTVTPSAVITRLRQEAPRVLNATYVDGLIQVTFSNSIDVKKVNLYEFKSAIASGGPDVLVYRTRGLSQDLIKDH